MAMDCRRLRQELDRDVSHTIGSDEACLSTAEHCEEAARYLARHLESRYASSAFDSKDLIVFLRQEVVTFPYGTGSRTVWDRIGALWAAISSSFTPSPSSGATLASEESRISVASALAKLERNLVAGLQVHQEAAMRVSVYLPDVC